MKLTKEELEKWEASGEIKRMSHSNIVKGIVNMKKAERTMSKSEYKRFRLLYEMELLTEDIYDLSCIGFLATVTDIVIRLKQAAEINKFISNEYILEVANSNIKEAKIYVPGLIVFLVSIFMPSIISIATSDVYSFDIFMYLLVSEIPLGATIALLGLIGSLIGALTKKKLLGLMIQLGITAPFLFYLYTIYS